MPSEAAPIRLYRPDEGAEILKGKKIHPDVSLVISPGSSKILSKMAENGALASVINAGGRIIENACGPCIGMDSLLNQVPYLFVPLTETLKEEAERRMQMYIL